MTDRETFEPLEGCWYLTGPTASGKTRVGLELAERLGAEILSLDSMAVYRGMDIGTAKPTREEQQRVPHHLIDLVDPTEDFSLSEYVRAAHAAAAALRDRNRTALFVGGTPLYLKALLRGVYPGPPADWEFRRQIEEELQQIPLEALHERLRLVDPLSAARLHPHDKRRIIRALEVYRQTGQPISHAQLHFDEVPRQRATVFVLQWERSVLHGRIEARVDRMFAAGLIEEVCGLQQRFGQLGRTASQAVGYREVLRCLSPGGPSREETVTQVKQRTRQFARRQETWFRSLAECRPVPLHDGFDSAEVAQRILAEAAA